MISTGPVYLERGALAQSGESDVAADARLNPSSSPAICSDVPGMP
jgi:hypothetical protein